MCLVATILAPVTAVEFLKVVIPCWWCVESSIDDGVRSCVEDCYPKLLFRVGGVWRAL